MGMYHWETYCLDMIKKDKINFDPKMINQPDLSTTYHTHLVYENWMVVNEMLI